MISQELLPPIQKPPHDPRSLLLDSRAGWMAAPIPVGLDPVGKDGLCGHLTLKAVPGSGRSVAEPSGSFGGITVPANVALGPDGSIYLLDAASLELNRFD